MTRKKNKPALEGGRPVRETPLPFFRASIDESDIEVVAETLRSGWLTVGPRTERFEKAISTYLGVGNALGVSSCSEAMFIALEALGLGPGDEVITTSLTFASTVHAIIHTGATPVLVDIEDESFGLDPADVERKITPRTRAILPVHFGGQPCRIEEICDIAAKRDLAVVEDAAHSFGAEVLGVRLGGHGDAVAFSFYATKNMTTGEGGAVTTDDAELADRMRLLSYHGMSRDSWVRYTDKGSWFYDVVVPGYKCNLNDVLAALGLSQIGKIDALLDARRRVASALSAALGDSGLIELPTVRVGNLHTWHLYVIRLRLDRMTIDRDRFIEALRLENIGSSVHFIPIYKHTFFEPFLVESATYPVCEDFFSRCVSLPIYPDMSDEDVEDVAEAVDKISRYYSKD